MADQIVGQAKIPKNVRVAKEKTPIILHQRMQSTTASLLLATIINNQYFVKVLKLKEQRKMESYK